MHDPQKLDSSTRETSGATRSVPVGRPSKIPYLPDYLESESVHLPPSFRQPTCPSNLPGPILYIPIHIAYSHSSRNLPKRPETEFRLPAAPPTLPSSHPSHIGNSSSSYRYRHRRRTRTPIPRHHCCEGYHRCHGRPLPAAPRGRLRQFLRLHVRSTMPIRTITDDDDDDRRDTDLELTRLVSYFSGSCSPT